MLRTLIILVMILCWCLFVLSVLLMSPKWWLWFWIGWAAGSNEYGSKKSVEHTLKKVAIITSILFMLCVIALPYIN